MSIDITGNQIKLPLKKQYKGLVENPCSIVCDKNGSLYAADEFAHCVVKFDNTMNKCCCVGKKGTSEGEFNYPAKIALDCSGNLFVIDKWNHRVQSFDPAGNFRFAFGAYGSGNGEFCEPWGIAVSAEGNIVVSDKGNGRFSVFDEQGKFKNHFGLCGVPYDFYESERFKRTVHYQQWIPNVHRLKQVENLFYELKFDLGEVEYPEEIVINSGGDIFIADRAGHHVVVYSSNFVFKEYLPVSEKIKLPSSLCVVPRGIIVADEINSKQVFINKEGILKDLVFESYDGLISSVCLLPDKLQLFVADGFSGTITLFDAEELAKC